MKTFIVAALVTSLVLCSNFFGSSRADDQVVPDLVLIGSTPCDSLMRAQLNIPQGPAIDFIRWELSLTEENDKKGHFLLHINYGVGKPNTNGFMSGGEKATLQGDYVVSDLNGPTTILKRFHLQGQGTNQGPSLVKLSDNIYHLLGIDNKLKRGNGGWSYTLNNRYPAETTEPLHSPEPSYDEKAPVLIFEGRTPCGRLPRIYDLKAPKDCYKIKWLLTLNRDPFTLVPSTYSFKRVLGSPAESTGKWSMLKGTNVLFYELVPDEKKPTITFLAGDENVIFFLDDKKQIFVGNEDFSYSLNRRVGKD